MATIILHQFDTSPFAEKLRLIFGLKGLAWKSVDAELVMPKPNLTALTGGYRKTPVMQIGADIYCDSRLIALELEERFPTPTLFPGESRATTLALSSWSDRDLHYCCSGLAIGVNKKSFPPTLMQDRKAFFGEFLNIDEIDKEIPHLATQLRAHADLIEKQLADGRLFWFGEHPGLADFQAYAHIWTTNNYLPFASELLASFPHMMKWIARVGAIGHGDRSPITAQESHTIARNSKAMEGKGVDPTDALKLSEGDIIEVTPDDYGREPVRYTFYNNFVSISEIHSVFFRSLVNFALSLWISFSNLLLHHIIVYYQFGIRCNLKKI